MVAVLCCALLLSSVPGAAFDSTEHRVVAAADSVAPPPRPVRRFPPIEVRAPLYDLRSSQTVHELAGASLRSLPIDGLVDALVLKPGVVAQGEELHVRGGRAGETLVSLEGLTLSEPARYRPMTLPLFAVARADLVSGVADARLPGSLAGVLELHTVDPPGRATLDWRWQTDGGRDTRYDLFGARFGAPLPFGGLGVVATGEAMLDDTWMPALRSPAQGTVLGLPVGWRAENRLLGHLKLAPVESPGRYSLEVAAGRLVHRPYDPAWSLDGWTFIPANPKSPPIFSPDPLPGYQRWIAADHLAVTDERQLATVATWSTRAAARRLDVRIGWRSHRAVTSLDGEREDGNVIHRPRYDQEAAADRFHVLWGDYPLYRESAGDVVMLRGDAELTPRSELTLRAGAGLTYEHVTLTEREWFPQGWLLETPDNNLGLDAERRYDASAPGGFAYAQGRWGWEGMILNVALRAEYWTPGPAADDQTLPGEDRGVVTLSPRLGIAYPVSTRDVFSLNYVRLHQPPGRDFLYDDRTVISDRQPLGNPALEPATVISYEAAVKHLFDVDWALQGAVFYRDAFGQVGARDYTLPQGPTDLRYENVDNGHALGFEWSVIHAPGGRRRLEAHYTWLNAYGNESRPEGDPYGPLLGANTPPLAELPLSWDRRHTLQASATWDWRERWLCSWSMLVGSPLPWTPKALRQPVTDPGTVNSERLGWVENTNAALQWTPARLRGLTFGLEVRNLFNHRAERAVTVDGYPNPIINTLYDDYGAYRTETGLGGGAYWSNGGAGGSPHWVPVGDERLYVPPRTVRFSVGASW
jgi:outer membrane receptor protein involved in Fe transport